ncbi:hypothetical protein PV328_008368 [Microctonus aethiopoides]|uniref:Uncharacterized protein n=1 Tax=Microctonus aethiopoides TaxID=144406 RepID=A0AA39KQV9_9HYME|nr:hypothetical protein PV328_008368 [Microctonus aethiopoides]
MLPNSYSYIGDLIDTLKEEDQTAEYNVDAMVVEKEDTCKGTAKMAVNRQTVKARGGHHEAGEEEEMTSEDEADIGDNVDKYAPCKLPTTRQRRKEQCMDHDSCIPSGK